MSDRLAPLIAELERLPQRSRTEILGLLNSDERRRLLSGERGKRIGHGERSSLAERSGRRADASESGPLSPWLDARIVQAREPGAAVPTSDRMTAAARQALLAYVDGVSAAGSARAAPRPGEAGGRSLVGAVGGLLPSRRVRS